MSSFCGLRNAEDDFVDKGGLESGRNDPDDSFRWRDRADDFRSRLWSREEKMEVMRPPKSLDALFSLSTIEASGEKDVGMKGKLPVSTFWWRKEAS